MTQERKGASIANLVKKAEADKTRKKAKPTPTTTTDTKGTVKGKEEAHTGYTRKPSTGTKAPKTIRSVGVIPVALPTPKSSDFMGLPEGGEKLKKATTYNIFIDWIALPENARNPRTQKEFSALYKVSEDTLSNWKKRHGFWPEVQKRTERHFREQFPIAVQALMLNLIKKGGAKEFMAFAQVIMRYNPKVIVAEEGGGSQYDPAQVKQLTDAMKNAGFGSVAVQHEEMAKAFSAVETTEDDED